MVLSKFYKNSLAFLFITLCTISSSAFAHKEPSCCKEPTCAPRVERKLNNNIAYWSLYTYLSPFLNEFNTRLDNVVDQATYQSLLDLANQVANNVPGGNGRILITLPDGTVVVDTARNDGVTVPVPQPNTSNTYSNSFTNFQQKNVNENHNSRIAILDAQLWPCGLGVETKFSTSTQENENYVAVRLGNYLDNAGTVRISQRVSAG